MHFKNFAKSPEISAITPIAKICATFPNLVSTGTRAFHRPPGRGVALERVVLCCHKKSTRTYAILI